MATGVLTKAKNKIASAFTHTEDEAPETYFIDEYSLKEWTRKTEPALTSGNAFIFNMKKFYPIETTLEFFAAMRDPFGFYTTKHKIANEDKFAEYDALGIEFTIAVPKGFEAVMVSAKTAQRDFEGQRDEFFALKGGELELTDEYYNRRNSRCYLTAVTAEEKEKLRYCQGVIAELEKLESILAKDPKNKEAISRKLYALPLPYFLKIVRTPTGTKLIPNGAFIKEGFAGTAHLGRYIPTSAEKTRAKMDRIPKLGERCVWFDKDMGDGTHRDFIVPEKDYETKYKNINTKLRPGIWNQQGRPYGEPLEFRESWKTPPHGKFDN